jgi:hypothetical protein
METKVEVTLDNTKLEDIIKNLKETKSYIKVGILGDSTEATIGATHEFGSIKKKTPARSFLRVPIENHLAEKAQNIELDLRKIKSYLSKLGTVAAAVVQEAFDTGGDGQWLPNSDETIRRKGSDRPLIDTGALRRTITFKVME